MSGPDHEAIKRMAIEKRATVRDFLVLSKSNDPFFIYPARAIAAHWIAQLFHELALPHGVHVRRLHYQLISRPTPPVCPDGRPYENTDRNWQALIRAVRDARYLGLIDARHIADHGIDAPLVHMPTDTDLGAWLSQTVGVDRPEDETVPTDDYFPAEYEFPEQQPMVLVSPPTIAEPYSIELWVEKTTLADVLVPLCQRPGVTLIQGVGEMSATQTYDIVQRARQHQRKTCVLYLADFDSDGDDMPVSVARPE